MSDQTDQPRRVLVVDDDTIVAASIVRLLQEAGHEADAVESGERALDVVDDCVSTPYAVMVTDMSLPGMNGLELITRLRDKHRDIVPLVITGYGTIESAVRAVRAGAIDYLTKPLVDEELILAVEKAIQQHLLRAENVNLHQQLDQRFGLDNIIGGDRHMRHIFEVIEAVAPSKTTVLMGGESGTGKSLIARAIHRNSPRSDKPFVEISCGSIPETLLESELFGHVEGAFTGAHTDKPGRFLAAHGGTLFLDEINSASAAMQLKLLRVLQERTFEPVGSNDTIEVDVRVILATNQALETLVATGQFRQDLFYRISVVEVHVPPLRERLADIPMLVEHFLQVKAQEAGKQVMGVTEDAMTALRAYAYPGNVRELENLVERGVVLTRSTRIGVEDLPPQVLSNTPQAAGMQLALSGTEDYVPMPLRAALETPERQIILAALEANGWNRQKTADELEINRTTLYKKIKQYGLDEQYGEAG